MKLSIVMPAYNERSTIRQIVSRVQAVDLGSIEKEIVIVDDGSTDGTREILEGYRGDPDIRVLLQPENGGKGSAVSRGIRESTGDIVLIQDTDLEYDPADYPILLRPILDGVADVVYGSRFLGTDRGKRVLYYWHSVGNKLLTFISNALTGLNLTDMETCYKAFTRAVVNRLDIQSPDFGIEPEITCKVSRLRVRVWEVPISYAGRTYEEGKKIGLKDAFIALWTTLKYSRWDPPETGEVTLRRMARLHVYNHWLHESFADFLGERVLEVGAGIGNQTQYFLDRERVIASDIEPDYLRELTSNFERHTNVRIASFRFPLSDEDRADLASERIDSIVCLNVLEHIEDHENTLRDFHAVLQPGGRLALLVPAMQALYGTLDVNLDHFRRYEREELRHMATAAGFTVEKIRFMNQPGVFAWWLNSRVLKRKILPKGQLNAVRWVMPILRSEEKRDPSFGMSLLVLARKNRQ